MCGCRNKGVKNVRSGRPIISPRGSSSSDGPGPIFSPRKAQQNNIVSSQSVPDSGLTADQRTLERKRRETILRKLGRL
jgi:hypothetical protein